jgi:hypothetical protein
MAAASVLSPRYANALCISGARYGNIPNVSDDLEINEGIERSQTETDRPNNPDYSTTSARSSSFFGWNSQNVGANDLVDAGFYYTGI